jgi:hypothetical protein
MKHPLIILKKEKLGMAKKIIIPCAAVLLLVVVSAFLFAPVRISSPTSEVRVYSIVDELVSLRNILNTFYNQERNPGFDEQLPANAPILSEAYDDYAAVYLRANVKNTGLLKSKISAVMINEKNLDDGVFMNKPGALSEEQVAPFEIIQEKGLTYIFICVKGMTDDEIFSYVKNIKLEVTVRSPIRTYTVPIDFSNADVSFYGEEA